MLAMAGSTPLGRAERREEWAFRRPQAVLQHSLAFAAHGHGAELRMGLLAQTGLI